MTQVSLIASLAAPPSTTGEELIALPDVVDWLEVRSDLVGDLSPEWLRSYFRGRLLYALRSTDEGGMCSDSPAERRRRLEAASCVYDRIELEAHRDLSEDLLAKIPAEKRCIVWQSAASDLASLKTGFEKLTSVPAAVYKIVTKAATIADEFIPLLLLKDLARSDTIAYAVGPMGFWSRLVALQLGAPAIFGLVPQAGVSPTEPTISKLIDDYGLPRVRPANEIFAIIGSPIFHSLSPRLHNAAYRQMNHPALFLPLQVDSFHEFWQQVVSSRLFDSLGFPLNGLTVASPHKEAALQTAKMISPMARQAESANILVRRNGWWKADTTDPQVIYMASHERSLQVRHKRAAVIGCGGAGRAIAAALVDCGAGVTLINRGAQRGQYASELLDLPYIPLLDFDAGGYDIVVNATPVGRDSDEVPFNLATLDDEVVIIDLVYGAKPTPLVDITLAREQVAIDGCDVLVTQVLQQFRMMTGKEMPPNLADENLGRRAANRSCNATVSLPNARS